MGSNYLLTLLELSPGTGHSNAEWSSTEHVYEGALALDLHLEAKVERQPEAPNGKLPYF